MSLQLSMTKKEVNSSKNMIIAVLGSKEMLEMEMKQLNNKHKTLYMKGQLYVVILFKKEKIIMVFVFVNATSMTYVDQWQLNFYLFCYTLQ